MDETRDSSAYSIRWRCRPGQGSATGWRVLAIRSDGTKDELLQRAGTFFVQDQSSLVIEALALEEVIGLVDGWIGENGRERRRAGTDKYLINKI